MAEALFRKAIAGRNDFSVKSAGVAASSGSPCSRDTKKICDAFDAPVGSFRSQPVSAKLLEEATHVFTMTRGHMHALEDQA